MHGGLRGRQLVVVESAEEGVVGEQSEAYVLQQLLALTLARLQVVRHPSDVIHIPSLVRHLYVINTFHLIVCLMALQ